MGLVSRRALFAVLVVLLVSGSSTGCRSHRQESAADDSCKPLPDQPNSYYVANRHSDRVIVFVHGIFGSSNCTWRFSKNVYWPDMIASDPDPVFRNTDVYVAGYDNPVLGNRMTVSDIVSNLRNRMESDGVFQTHRQVIIVAHSLGGIIAQKFLLSNTALASKVPFLYFYGTPNAGSQIAKIGHVFSANPLLLQMFKSSGDDETYLTQMKGDWRSASFPIKRYCMVERVPTDGVMVVDKESAEDNCDEVVAVSLDHIHLVKPDKRDKDPYIALRVAVNRLPVLPPTPAPMTQPTGPTKVSKTKSRKTDPCAAKNFDDRPVTCNG